MAQGLRTLGVSAQPTSDGLGVEGGALSGGKINSRGDHRIAMAFAIAGLLAGDDVVITDCHNVRTSFPGFVQTASAVGLQIAQTYD